MTIKQTTHINLTDWNETADYQIQQNRNKILSYKITARRIKSYERHIANSLLKLNHFCLWAKTARRNSSKLKYC